MKKILLMALVLSSAAYSQVYPTGGATIRQPVTVGGVAVFKSRTELGSSTNVYATANDITNNESDIKTLADTTNSFVRWGARTLLFTNIQSGRPAYEEAPSEGTEYGLDFTGAYWEWYDEVSGPTKANLTQSLLPPLEGWVTIVAGVPTTNATTLDITFVPGQSGGASQPLEDQRLSTTDDVVFYSVTATNAGNKISSYEIHGTAVVESGIPGATAGMVSIADSNAWNNLTASNGVLFVGGVAVLSLSNVVQTTGTNTAQVMSQNAVGEAIAVETEARIDADDTLRQIISSGQALSYEFYIYTNKYVAGSFGYTPTNAQYEFCSAQTTNVSSFTYTYTATNTYGYVAFCTNQVFYTNGAGTAYFYDYASESGSGTIAEKVELYAFEVGTTNSIEIGDVAIPLDVTSGSTPVMRLFNIPYIAYSNTNGYYFGIKKKCTAKGSGSTVTQWAGNGYNTHLDLALPSAILSDFYLAKSAVTQTVTDGTDTVPSNLAVSTSLVEKSDNRKNTFILLGDSLTSPDTLEFPTIDGNGIYQIGYSWFNWMRAFLPTQIRLISNEATGGWTTSNMLADITASVNTDADYAIICGGRNDVSRPLTSAETISNLTSIITQLQDSGKKIFIMTVPSVTTVETEYQQQMLVEINKWICQDAPILFPDLTAIDTWSVLASYSTSANATTNVAYDHGTHWASQSTMLIGKKVADEIAKVLPSSPQIFPSNVNKLNLFPRASFTNAATPVLTTNCTASIVSDETYIGKSNLVITVTNGTIAGTYARYEFTPASMGSGVTTSNRIYVIADISWNVIDTLGFDSNFGPDLWLRNDNSTNSTKNARANFTPASVWSVPDMVLKTGRCVLRTPAIQGTAAGSYLLYFNFGGISNGTFTIHRAAILQE